MRREKKPNILLNSKIAVGIVVAILFVLGLLQVAQGFIDTRNYREEIIAAIKAQTGREVAIRGSVTVSLLPYPTLYIPGMELRDLDSDKPAPAATIDMVRIRVPFGSIFSPRPRISTIVLERPVLELVRADDRIIHWDWLNNDLLKALTANQDPGNPLEIDVINGKILYHDNRTDKNTVIEDIGGYITTGSTVEMAGDFRMYGHDLDFEMTTEAAQGDATPFHFVLKSADSGDNSTLKLDGTINLTGELPDVQAKLEADVADIFSWAKEKEQELEKKGLTVDNPFGNAQVGPTVVPLKLKGDWAQQGLTVNMSNVEINGLNSTGTGSLKLSWKEWMPVIDIAVQFSTLSYEEWKDLIQRAFKREDSLAERVYRSRRDDDDSPIPTGIQMSLDVTAQQLFFGKQAWSNAKLAAHMGDGTITVNQFNIELPGEATLTLFGVVSRATTTNDLRFEGSMETKGKSLRYMLTIFDESAKDLPELGAGDFFARSNIFISTEQLRLSEADAKLSDLRLSGGLVAYFDAKPRLEAEVKLTDINFDYFRDRWREQMKGKPQGKQKDFFLKFDRSLNFDWLRKLNTSIDFKVTVDQFTFFEKKGDRATFRLYASQGNLGIYDLSFVYPNELLKGSFKLDVKDEKPFMNLALSANEIDTAYFQRLPEDEAPPSDNAEPVESPLPDNTVIKLEPQAATITLAQADLSIPSPAKPAEVVEDILPARSYPKGDITKRWSQDLIDTSWMGGYSGTIDFNIGHLKHGDYNFDNVKMTATIDNELLVIKNLSFRYWEGQVSVLGSMYGGKVPGFSISFTMLDAEIRQALHSLVGRDNVTGRISVSATLSTSGVNYLSWVSQSEGKFSLAARGVMVDGINLAGVIDAVTISRTASDVFNSVNMAMVNGSTLFSVDGNLNLKNGNLKTPGMNLKADTVLGNLSGEIRMVPLNMDLSTLFQFPSLSSDTVPTMVVQLSGPLDNGDMRADTASLEAYVAKRITSK